GMRAEEARAAAYCGRALVQLNQITEAQTYLAKAHELFSAEQNEVGASVVKLTQANLHYRQGNFALAGKMSAEAEASLETSGNWQRLLLARWLYGETERATGNLEIARIILEQNLEHAEAKLQPAIAEQCMTSLGLIAWQTGDVRSSEDYFRRAIDVIEDLRAPLPSEEFRTAFFADKLAPYREMVRLCLAANRIEDALAFVERARSRTLAESLAGNLRLPVDSNDQFEADSLKQIETLRGELNYLYNQLSRSIAGASMPGSSETSELQRALRDREDKLLEITRQLNQRSGRPIGQAESFSVKDLQARLGNRTALVEYAAVDDELLAFLVTNERVEVLRNLGVESEVASEIAQFRFQIDSLRYTSSSIRRHMPLLTERVRKHLTSLYELLLRPLEPIIAGRQLAIVPHRALHYLPFQALYDGSRYVVESREVSYVPSAAILQQCLERPPSNFDTALLFGVADEQIPRVRDEIEGISTTFTRASSFLNEAATSEILHEKASAADVVHLACHAQFRSDNPLFSSLQLGDGWLTVQDATQLKLNCGLVTLSACETGVSAIAPGDELIGLARGFFTAGSPSVLLSLWTVDDQATAELMVEFYNHLKAGEMPAAALRSAQVKILKQMSHPFFWAAFVLVGRW
ncbi:MAG TPA: CHAT domain-containing protein, partial [Pyrinomonadaceae bacterium]|nr:CHAT domain-containing protein [Pyrinomonadaceae bacterium]